MFAASMPHSSKLSMAESSDILELFMNTDPIGFMGGQANLTEYVGNHPTDGIDPTGLREAPGFWGLYWEYLAPWNGPTAVNGWDTALQVGKWGGAGMVV